VFGDDWEGDNFDFDTLIVDGEVTGIPADIYSRRVLTPYGRNVYSLFGEDSIKLAEHYSLLLGFRYDRVEAPQIDHPNNFSPRIALVVTPTEKTVLKAMYTAGAAFQINAANTSPDAIALGNVVHFDAEKPERLDSFELAASYQPNPSTYLAINAFYNTLQDIFGVDPAVEPPPFRIINFGRIDYVGFEAIASANLTRQAFLRLIHQHVQFGSVVRDIYNFLPTPDKQHPSNYPEDVTKILGDVRIRKHFSANANANLIWNDYGGNSNGQTQSTGFYSTVNANLIWELDPHAEIMLSVYNLFNEQKQIPPFFLLAELPERNFNVNFSYSF
jgi:outer membrane receptor protein involved in Fe transport